MIFIVGMWANFSASQDLASVNDEVINRYAVISTKSYDLSISYENQRSIFKSYSNGQVTGMKEQFTSNEQELDQNISDLQSLLSDTSANSTINNINAERDIFYASVVNGIMTLPTEQELADMELTGESMLSDALNMYLNVIEYKITGNVSNENDYLAYKSDFSNLESTFTTTLSEVQGINTTIYGEFNIDFSAMTTYYNNWVNNDLQPAISNSSLTATDFIQNNADSVLPIETSLNGIDHNISIYYTKASAALTTANNDLQPILDDLKGLRTFSTNEMANGKEQATAAVNLVFTSTFTVVLAGILFSIFIGFGIANTISSPLTSLSSSSKNIASGDLTVDIQDSHTKRVDEIGELANHFNQMVAYLKETVYQISTVAGSLSSAATEMASSSEEVNSSSEEISAIAQQMAKGSMEQTNQINEAVRIALSLRGDFEEKIANINQTSLLIENISSQVNMLALNASIEAARAGEYGRGFAVVADNIRKLADDSKSSVGKVQTVIESLKGSLSKSIDNLTSSIEKIASVAEETSSGAEESSAATEEQAATMQEMAASAQELANIAFNLEELVKRFKVE